MNSKVAWLVSLVLLVTAALLFSSNHKQQVELAGLRAQTAQMAALQAELDQVKAASFVQADQVASLQTNTVELLKLRNQVYQLGREKQQLAQQLQSAQANVAIGQQQAQQLQQLQAQNQQLINSKTLADEVSIRNKCINNLRQIDGAKHQWALENKMPDNAVPTEKDLAVYIKNNLFPVCPDGGTYTIGAVNVDPVCSVPGHALPKP